MKLGPKNYLIVWSIWSVIAVIALLQTNLFWQPEGDRYLVIDTGFHFLASTWGWAILIPLIVLIFNKFPLEKSVNSILWNAVSCLIISHSYRVVVVVLDFLFRKISGFPISAREAFSTFQNMSIPTSFVKIVAVYWLIMGAIYSISYFRLYVESKQQLVTAQLNNLKAQLQPHFLFNTFQSISTLMHKDVNEADKAIEKLCALLRRSIDESGKQKISLKEELSFIEEYLELQDLRYHERLEFKIDSDEKNDDLEVPNLVLQPLVENVFKHSVEKVSQATHIHISSLREGNVLKLCVRNNQANSTDPVKYGVGLTNTRDRLKQLYSDKARLSVEYQDGEFVSTVIIPAKG